MVCCCIPLLHWIDRKSPREDKAVILIITEICRWIVIAVPIYMTCWRYAELRGYTEFISGWDIHVQYWIIVTLVFLLASLLVYLPIKVIGFKVFRRRYHRLAWRPSILLYLIICALPCLAVNLIAAKTDGQEKDFDTLDPATTVAVQVTVLGLTFTEWMSKVRDEQFTYDLVTAMATDFFFLYDVIDMFMLSYKEAEVFQSDWVYGSFVFGYIALYKYLPRQPTTITEFGTPKGAVVCIVVSMLCVDLPFFVIRMAAMLHFGFQVGDLIHPIKNLALLCFGCTELYIIYINNKYYELGEGSGAGDSGDHADKLPIEEHRCCRVDALGACPPDGVASAHPGVTRLDMPTSRPDDPLPPPSPSGGETHNVRSRFV